MDFRERAVFASGAHNPRFDNGPTPASQELHAADGHAGQENQQYNQGIQHKTPMAWEFTKGIDKAGGFTSTLLPRGWLGSEALVAFVIH